MSSVINTNIAAIRTHNVYSRNDTQMNAALTRVATGMKINSAKDGASTWAISEKMRERIRANDQANQNVQNDTALLKTAQGGIGNTIDILKTLKERAINSANDSNMNIDRSAIATEIYQLVSQIDDNAAKVKFNGRTLINGDWSSDSITKNFEAAKEANEAEEVTPEAPTITEESTQLAVYNIDTSSFTQGFWDSSANSGAGGERTLGSLQKTSGTNVFSASNVIELSWKYTDENGDEQTDSTSYTVATNETVSDLTAALSDADKGIYVQYLRTTSDYVTSDAEGTRVTDENGDDLKASVEGLYIVGLNGAISDVKLNVLASAGGAASANGNQAFSGATSGSDPASAAEVQEAAEVEDSSDNTADIKGDHSVFSIAGLGGVVSSGAAADLATTTNLKDLTLGLKSIVKDSTFTAATGDMLRVTYGEGDNDYVEVDFSTGTIDTLKTALKDKGINLQVLAEGDQLRDVDDNIVLQSGYSSTPLRAEAAGLYFVGSAKAEDSDESPAISNITISLTDASESDAAVKLQKGMATAQAVVEYEDTSATEEEDTTVEAGLTFYVGGEANFGIQVGIGAMTTEKLLGMKGEDFAKKFLTKDGAQEVISTIDTALQTAMTEQTYLGAVESRLGYTSDNIVTMNENLEAADSVMRDSDIAKEMTNYMKYSVLAQASQYMLAQSSQNAFSVLNLLQA